MLNTIYKNIFLNYHTNLYDGFCTQPDVNVLWLEPVLLFSYIQFDELQCGDILEDLSLNEASE